MSFEIKNKFISLIEDEVVFFIALLLAILSCFFVKPSLNYLNYIDYKTLVILFVMMVFVQILEEIGIFDKLINKLLNHVNTSRGLVLVLVFICFFSSIFITNDVSLITFVPFSIMALKKVGLKDLIIITVVLQTIAANMGCMLLPIGAPHNIYIYSVSGISFGSFILLLLIYVVVSFVFLLICCCFIKSNKINSVIKDSKKSSDSSFFKRIFYSVDYFLLLTFVAFFILIGNLQCIPQVVGFFKTFLIGNELICSIIASQIISNVPAAMMLSGFSKNYNSIILGINIGGLGTLIASMANLISYKIFVKEFPNFKYKFILIFTLLNIILLIILLGVYYIGILMG